jgi:hypothetical protein
MGLMICMHRSVALLRSYVFAILDRRGRPGRYNEEEAKRLGRILAGTLQQHFANDINTLVLHLGQMSHESGYQTLASAVSVGEM